MRSKVGRLTMDGIEGLRRCCDRQLTGEGSPCELPTPTISSRVFESFCSLGFNV